ncbi:MAG: hypothetical protein GAK45_01956 [Pseudomonas citronellolis]|nr:MAG: hypothetical protein GAK45_01956 [Pseudomonas citronellolis]
MPRKPQPSSKLQRQVEAAGIRARQLHEAGQYQQALTLCLQTARRFPGLAAAWSDAAANCVRLQRWEEAVAHARRARAAGGEDLALFDALSHAHCALGQVEPMRQAGLAALQLRDRQFSALPSWPMPAVVLPPPPSETTRTHNLIAFSLFGQDVKYCETAVLNAQEQPRLYPHWTCRFYVDDSVPASVQLRLLQAGAQVHRVDEEVQRWPGPMWRLLALEEPGLHRVLMRDADSVISQREAAAVQEWLDSGRYFHALRDNGTHTELLLAGLWGAVGGALPPLREMLAAFFATHASSAHFADQHFLRRFVWPYARHSLLQHDSQFGFLEARPFPGGAPPTDFHVGCAEGASSFELAVTLAEGVRVQWSLYRRENDGDEQQVCRYPAQVEQGRVRGHLPGRYLAWLRDGSARLQVEAMLESVKR